MTYKYWISTGILFIAALTLKGQELTFPEKIQQSFQDFFDNTPQEKVYLHTDKTTYTANDRIWLKAYLTDATYHIPDLLSKFIYVELADQQDSVRQRIKLRRTDSCFFGNIQLPVDITPGNYCIRAYTNWMQNNDEEFFFKKNIRILNTVTDVNILANHDISGGKVTTTLTLADNTGKPYDGQRVKIELKHKNRAIKNNTARCDDKGCTTIEHLATDSADRITLAFPNNLPFKFNTTVYLPAFSTDFDLQFFPEGGHLLAGTTQTIAFKAIDANGKPTEVEGNIYDRQDKIVTPFKSTHRGMGTFHIITQTGEQYYAVAKTKNGTEKKISLPALSDNHLALCITARPGNENTFLISVKKSAACTPGRQLYLIVQTRGKLVGVLPVDENFIGELKTGQFSPGITHFILVDDHANIYSERLRFIRPAENGNTTLHTDKEKYDRREKVTLRINLKNQEGVSAEGNCSLSVTDNTMVTRDTAADNIISYFLLHSDLKGYIEAPGTYLNESPAHIDLLMLTHGWTRFNVGNMLNGQTERGKYALEIQQQLKGKITNYNNKAMARSTVQIFVPALQTLGSVHANEEGIFTIKDISFPDSTLFLIRGFKAKGGQFVDVHMLENEYKPVGTFFPGSLPERQTTRNEFLDRFKGDHYFQDGVKIYILGEANVIRHRPKNKNNMTGEYTDMADQILDREALSKMPAGNIYQLLMRLPGVSVAGEKISVRGSSDLLFMIDGTPMDAAFLSGIMPEDIDNIGVIKDGARLSFFGTRASGGVIIINTRHGNIGYRETPGLIKYRPLGYHIPDEFYMPRYEQTEIKNQPEIDYRSTIYWNPNIQADSNGHAEVTFFTADLNATYTITLEGLDKNGELYRQVKTIRRE